MTVYLDVLILLNFMVDLCLLVATNRLSGYAFGVKRAALGAAVGGIYGGACVLPGFSFLAGTLWRIVSLLVIGVIAFGFERGAIRRCVVFTLLSMALGGIATGLESGSFFAILLSAAGVTAMCAMGFSGRLGNQYVKVSVGVGEKLYSFHALVDTGNALTDPLTGQQIIIVSAHLAQKLAGLSQRELEDPALAVEQGQGLRLIPFHAVGVSHGMLVGKRFENVTVGKRRGSYLIGFAPNELGRGMPYQALTGGVL